MHIKTYASSECIDERGRGHAFAAFLNMQLASTPALCVCSCCLLTLCACLHIFVAQERTRKTAKLADKYGMKNISRPCLWKCIPIGSVSHTVVRKCCPKPSDPINFIPGPCEEYFYYYYYYYYDYYYSNLSHIQTRSRLRQNITL